MVVFCERRAICTLALFPKSLVLSEACLTYPRSLIIGTVWHPTITTVLCTGARKGSRQGLQHTIDAPRSRGTGQIAESRRQSGRSVTLDPRATLDNLLFSPITP